MLFSSNFFIFVFLPLVIAGYFLIKTPFQNYYLLIVSLLFYAWGEPKFVLLLIVFIAINYSGALVIRNAEGQGRKHLKKIALIALLIFDVGVLFVFKYLNFITANLSSLSGGRVPATSIPLPIGISFFTFMAISYVVDVYRGKVEAQKNPLLFALYISFFPKMIAGPIVRYTAIKDQLQTRTVTFDSFTAGVKRFIQGFAKKIILADSFSTIANQAFGIAGTSSLSVAFAWLGSIAYSLHIFFDFAGYSEMAIGLAKMFGFQFLENFDYPYISRTITEFWRRWHISLGTWFRDYVYFPLGGSRVNSKFRLVLNLFAVWFLTGVWHGANWNYLAWGLLYFVLLVIEKLAKIPEKIRNKPDSFKAFLYRVFTLLSVNCGWVLFRADGLKAGLRYLSVMFGLSGNVLTDAYIFRYSMEYMVPLLLGVLCSTPVFKITGEQFVRAFGKQEWIVNTLSSIWYILLFLISVSYLVIGSHNPFVYLKF